MNFCRRALLHLCLFFAACACTFRRQTAADAGCLADGSELGVAGEAGSLALGRQGAQTKAGPGLGVASPALGLRANAEGGSRQMGEQPRAGRDPAQGRVPRSWGRCSVVPGAVLVLVPPVEGPVRPRAACEPRAGFYLSGWHRASAGLISRWISLEKVGGDLLRPEERNGNKLIPACLSMQNQS